MAQCNTCGVYKINLNEQFLQIFITQVISCYQGQMTDIYYTKGISLIPRLKAQSDFYLI